MKLSFKLINHSKMKIRLRLAYKFKLIKARILLVLSLFGLDWAEFNLI